MLKKKKRGDRRKKAVSKKSRRSKKAHRRGRKDRRRRVFRAKRKRLKKRLKRQLEKKLKRLRKRPHKKPFLGPIQKKVLQKEKAKKGAPRLPRRKRDKEGTEASEHTTEDSPLQIYLKQIEKIPLLTPQDEVDLSRRIMNEERDAKQARERMIRSNLRLVISIAKRYTNIGLPFSDLIEEGNIGLMRAVDKFNYKRGYRFSTYASWWIKQGIMRALSNQGKTIRIPVYMYDLISRWRKVRDHLMQKLDRIPTRREISKVMKVTVAKIKDIENLATRPSSLNMPVSIDSTAELIDLIEDASAEAPEQLVDELFKEERIDQLLSYVDDRERQILILRFGLKGGEPHTLELVAQKFGITRERVRQIEHAALKKIQLRVNSEKDHLEDYVY